MPESSQQQRAPKRRETGSNGPIVKRTRMGLNQKFVDALGWVITVMWAASMMLHAANIGYEPPASIHLLMMVVAGTAFGTSFVRTKDGDANGE